LKVWLSKWIARLDFGILFLWNPSSYKCMQRRLWQWAKPVSVV
jgi:hypothetical protein